MELHNLEILSFGKSFIRKLQLSFESGLRMMRRLLQLRIGLRLLASFLILILLTSLIGFLAAQKLGRLSATINDLNTHGLPDVITISHLHAMLDQQNDLEQRLVSRNDLNTTVDLATLASTMEMIEKDRAALLSNGPNDLDAQLNAELIQDNTNSSLFLALIKNQSYDEAHLLLQSQQGPLLQILIDETSQLRKDKRDEVTAAAANVQQQSNQLTWFIIWITLFSVLVSVAVALLITRSLTRPLSALLISAQAMATDGLKVDSSIYQSDELGQLAATFNSMFVNLRSTIAIRALERLQTQAIIEAIADGVILFDGQLQIIQINPAAERLTGWPEKEAVSHNCWEVLGCENQPSEQFDGQGCLTCPLRLAMENHTVHIAEKRAHARNGEQRWFALSCAPILESAGSPEMARLVVSVHDISQLKKVEQLKTDFVALVSHELRAPLTTVAASVETLELVDPIQEQESYHEVVGILSQQTKRLRRVVEEVLQFTQVDAGRFQVNLQPVQLHQFLDELLYTMRLSWIDNDRSLEFTAAPESELTVWADRAALEIVVRNLLDNACKYTPSDSTIEIIVETAREEGHVQVRVNDHGPGIPADQLSQIFQPFSRGSYSSSNWIRGYGLGLYIAREILRVHSGEIWAENRRDGGASFVFTLCSVTDDTFQAVEVGPDGL